MYLKPFLFVLAVTSFGLPNAVHAQKDSRLTDAQIAKLPPEHQKLVRYMRELKSSGAAGMKSVSFEQTKNNTAISAIFDKNNQPGPMYIAEVMEGKGSPTVGFRVGKDCEDTTQQRRLTERTIKVDDLKISAYYVCGKDSGGNLHQMFIPRTQAGKDALYSTFLNRQVVFVTLDSVEIPFETAGFQQVWDEVSRPAL